MIKERIIDLIKKAVIDLGIPEKDIPVFTLEHPDEMSHGDFACNVALMLVKQLKNGSTGSPQESPVEVVRQIVGKVNEVLRQAQDDRNIEKISIAGPGFINFYLSDKYFTSGVEEVLKLGEKYGENNNLKKQKTIIEYTDPNPFKEFHIGHLMSNSVGEAISRIVEANGAEVKRANYQGDVGIHVAKAIWGALEALKHKPESKKEFFGNWLGAGVNPGIWGQAYAFGATAFESDEKAKREITELNKKIYERSDGEINKLYDVGRKVSLKEFERVYKILGTKFDKGFYFFESETGGFGKKIIDENIKNGIFEKSDGAVIFRGEKYGLHTRVFVNSEGLPTYEAKELGLAKIKYDKFKYDKSIVITGNEINDYFKVLLQVMSLVFPDLAEKTVHISHGMLRLPSGKMSSRTGQVITGESLLTEIQKNVLEKMKDREMSEKEKKQTAEIVAVGALKYSILKQVTDKDIIFDFDKSLSFEGDSGPYLQYSYVRAVSILGKAKKEGVRTKIDSAKEIKASELSKLLVRFPEVVERAGEEYSPHYLATYLIQLAGAFSTFYAKETIVDKNDENSSYKVALTEAFSIVMKNGLNLLGIKVPERM